MNDVRGNMNNVAHRLTIARRSPQQPQNPWGKCEDCGKEMKKYDWDSYRAFQLGEDGSVTDYKKPRCCERCAEAP